MARRGQETTAIERQKLARLRFRSLIRSVMYNRIWLTDDDEQKKIVLNVRRNVAMLVRPRHKIGVLTMAEKGLIRCPHSLRTNEDRKLLLKLVTNLECFRNFSPQIRARLIPVIKFVYLEAGRKIIKEGGTPNTIYFLLYGEVEASRRMFDSYKGAFVEKIEFIYSSGDCIGEIELIERTQRTHNYTATSAVELLVVFETDFDRILRAVMTKQWYQKRAALNAIGYFSHFSEEQVISATKLSALKEFDALETIYHEDLGEASHAYFVLSGECMILQSLQLQVMENRYNKTYELLNLISTKNSNQNMLNVETLRTNTIDIGKISDSDADYYSEVNEINVALPSITTKSSVEDIYRNVNAESISQDGVSRKYQLEYESLQDMDESRTDLGGIDFGTRASSTKISVTSRDVESLVERAHDSIQRREDELELRNKRQEVEKKSWSDEKDKSESGISSEKTSVNTSLHNNENISIETRFIDVGSLVFGGIFGIGEKIESRVIMARTKVQCLLLPRYWLFEKDQNPGRIWQRRRFVINTSIPSRWQLYKDFLNTRKWQKYKNIFMTSLLDPKSIKNPTHYQDIPVMFHIINPGEE